MFKNLHFFIVHTNPYISNEKVLKVYKKLYIFIHVYEANL